MNPSPSIQIRTETANDHDQVREVVRAAFAGEALSDQTEHLLVDRLRPSDAFIPGLSLIAESGGKIVGHLLLTRLRLETDSGPLPGLALAPVSVLPEFQGKGIGGAMIGEAQARAEQTDAVGIFLLGHPGYYPRFGYETAGRFGVEFPWEVPQEACMVLWLKPELAQAGKLVYADAFMENG